MLFKLAEQGYSVTVRPFPQSFWAYIRHGLVVPLVQWPDGSLTPDSFDILARDQLYINTERGVRSFARF